MVEIGGFVLMPMMFSFMMSYVFIRACKPIAIRYGLVDTPGGRKVHQGDVPLIGGIAIFLSSMSSLLLFAPSSTQLRLYLMASITMLFIGVLDDRYNIKVSHRLFSQALASALMVFGAEIYLESLGDLAALGALHTGWFGPVLTMIAVIGAINAFNMVDGIDGLAGCLSIISLGTIGLLMHVNGNPWELLAITYIGGIAAYLMFNNGWPNRRLKKIFMGDAGAMVIGFTVVWLLVTGSQGEQASFRPVTALWIIAFPLMDMASIMYRRMRQGKSPFLADRQHLHHIFLRMGFSPKQALFVISMGALFMAAIGVMGEAYQVHELIMLALFLAVFFLYCWVIQHVWQILTWYRRLAGIDGKQ
ncbi:UDP-N-acetylglucosamine--undecaprenyl-phosphate N-acetylglucosaminephosphotransferase [Ferrimonas balearica]|uniref:UDP-N-acetylglucosamine--undecaprenyl-phosphate N-acetylglucosaminephosphotransferase n=1 Tax=Ferrimonas balearica TaxID=44012 RepID=UPI001C59F072|nr:UDP-N-acetylglucosamine--undecaprenyl-phosphate N-acetylglucosaminephosphotransferase [Ferrimonas balearica]MBW3164261.1 UDP-N-acetylglucosamine--undecaprenyl-phosphate N-acetylglucosaminephosphotransferase [Ferrimonas balearica]MBY6225099.1 UDP-N-acetylglucosamine--undecaprenyl-phosphate N-acetylglucosaminephosphotransferase [Ferrimonas balearica]